jgi:hypothetical protein
LPALVPHEFGAEGHLSTVLIVCSAAQTYQRNRRPPAPRHRIDVIEFDEFAF